MEIRSDGIVIETVITERGQPDPLVEHLVLFAHAKDERWTCQITLHGENGERRTVQATIKRLELDIDVPDMRY